MDSKTEEDRNEEEMEPDGKERQEEEGENDPGFNPQVKFGLIFPMLIFDNF